MSDLTLLFIMDITFVVLPSIVTAVTVWVGLKSGRS